MESKEHRHARNMYEKYNKLENEGRKMKVIETRKPLSYFTREGTRNGYKAKRNKENA